jgi:hypothetical protein
MINNGKVNRDASASRQAEHNVLTAYVWGLSNKATVAAVSSIIQPVNPSATPAIVDDNPARKT